jgi:hypothetical protein
LILRGFVVQTYVRKTSGIIRIALVSLQKPVEPPPRVTRRRTIESVRRTRRPDVKGSPSSKPIVNKPKPLPIETRIPSRSNPDSAKVPVLDKDYSEGLSLPNPSASSEEGTSATGASSHGKGTGRGAGDGRGGEDLSGLVSVTMDKVPVEGGVIGEKFQVYSEDEIPLIRGLEEIADHVVEVNKSRKVDVVFIIDTSESMQNDIDAVRRHLDRMIKRFQQAGIDFTLGVVRFHHSPIYEWLGVDITISPQTNNVEKVRDILGSIKVSGGERALDAIMEAISKVKFRKNSDRHFVLVTDEYVKGTYAAPDVLKSAKRAKITIDVLGRDEPFQRTIAEQTGGIWTPIEKIRD